MDFLKAIDVKTCEVTLAGKTFVVEQRNLVDYYRLRALLDVIVLGEDQQERLDAIFDYISIATGMDDLSNVETHELSLALDSLVSLNTEQVETLLWQKSRSDIEAERIRVTADYEHRDLAVIVNMLAAAYGWKQEQILSLSPEVVSCYVQEILLDEWKRNEFQYLLSEVAYNEKGKYKPFPPLSWYTIIKGPTVKEATMKIPKRFLPAGIVYDLTKENVRNALKDQKK